jgi:protein involved in polysaccharide export with SLBB domain
MASLPRWWPLFVVPVIGGLPGCAAKNADMLHFLREHEHKVSAIEYRVGIPDTIGISAPRILEVDAEAQRIQPDGKINLRLLGEVKVVGMTVKEIGAKLEVLLSRYYVDPKVSVRVLSYASKKYYVYGEATATGPRPYTGRDTLLDAVLTSGVDFLSWTSRITVTRPAHGEEPVRTILVNVDKMLKTGDWSQNILLEPDDVVYIPPTPIAWLGHRLQEVIYPVRPAVQAYTAPAEMMYAQDAYDDEYRHRGYGGRYRIR